jgi:hypothetical protein
MVGDESCLIKNACGGAGSVGSNSCTDLESCPGAAVVGDNSCTGQESALVQEQSQWATRAALLSVLCLQRALSYSSLMGANVGRTGRNCQCMCQARQNQTYPTNKPCHVVDTIAQGI